MNKINKNNNLIKINKNNNLIKINKNNNLIKINKNNNLIVDVPNPNHKHCKICKCFVIDGLDPSVWGTGKDICILCDLLQKYGCSFCGRKQPLFFGNEVTQKGCSRPGCNEEVVSPWYGYMPPSFTVELYHYFYNLDPMSREIKPEWINNWPNKKKMVICNNINHRFHDRCELGLSEEIDPISGGFVKFQQPPSTSQNQVPQKQMPIINNVNYPVVSNSSTTPSFASAEKYSEEEFQADNLQVKKNQVQQEIEDLLLEEEVNLDTNWKSQLNQLNDEVQIDNFVSEIKLSVSQQKEELNQINSEAQEVKKASSNLISGSQGQEKNSNSSSKAGITIAISSIILVGISFLGLIFYKKKRNDNTIKK